MNGVSIARFIIVTVLATGLLMSGHGSAHAYIDPGTGGMLLQLLLGGVAGALVIIKLYWARLRSAFAQFFGVRSRSRKADEK